MFSLSLSLSRRLVTAPRFQLTRYKCGEMDNCEEFWEDFYDRLKITGNHSRQEGAKVVRKARATSKTSRRREEERTIFILAENQMRTLLDENEENEEENTREEAREARAFARACRSDPSRRKFRGEEVPGPPGKAEEKRVVVSAFTTITRIRMRKVLGNSSFRECGRSSRGDRPWRVALCYSSRSDFVLRAT